MIMKKLILFSAALLTACSTELQLISTDLPPTVSSAFAAKYPGATDAKWEAEKENGRLVFEAEFEFDGKHREATFRPDGTFVDEDNN